MLKKERRITNTLPVAAILFSLVFSIILWQGQTIDAFAQGTAKVMASSGKIREKADTSSTVLASVEKGDSLDVTASTKDSNGYTWYKVFVDGQSQGYIRGDLVTVEGTIPGESSSLAAASTTAASTTVASGGNVTTVGSGGNVTTVGGGGSTTAAPQEEDNGEDIQEVMVSPSQVVRAKVTEQVRVRKGAGTSYDVAGSAAGATEVAVSGEASDSEGKIWYQVSFESSGKTVSGFIRQDFLEVLETAPIETQEEESIEETLPEEPAVNEDYYLKYMQNETGEWDWYLFDQIQGTSQSLTQLLEAVKQIEEGNEAQNSQATTMKIIIIVMAVVLILLVVAVTVLLFKLHDSYEDYDEEDDEEEYEMEEEEDEDEIPARRVKSRFGRRREQIEERNTQGRGGTSRLSYQESEEEQEKPKSREKGTWQSKDFLELDDDMEFEFLDL